MSQAQTFQLEVNPSVPRRLIRLEELANNLWYSWDHATRMLFARLHPGLWDAVGHSPKAFLKRVDEQRLVDAAQDQIFLGSFNRVLSAYDTYHNEPLRRGPEPQLRQSDMVAYFCAEFGFHESFPIYSGGLGILAGDHCKSASDLRLPFVGVGLLYRQGYFLQTIDAEGSQVATYTASDFDDLPVQPALGEDGTEIRVQVELPGRTVHVKVWTARVGHVRLCLLDTHLPENGPEDRDITHQLYGGDRGLRIKQEIVLGVGGVRALKELGVVPTVWHINEGHAAFLVLERARHLMRQGLDFAAAIEAVAVNTVFTTHTPVPAGHDHFSPQMIDEYFHGFYRDLEIGREDFLNLGRSGDNPDFNMTALAVRGSRHHNGVSRIHGRVSSQICSDLWPQIATDENPISYVTNGVHVPTFLAHEWADLFDNFLGYEWRHRFTDVNFWERIDQIPDHLFWSVRQALKAQMLNEVRFAYSRQQQRNNVSEAHLDRMLKLANPMDPNVLTIGFARRFATYKRATLLFHNLDWLSEIISDRDRPVLFIFAGKAHPADVPGQNLIRAIHALSRQPAFEGKLLLLEGYDLNLARQLVAGVDVWLNNPVYPLEASGTSGMKAAINGAINLSVLDGWWGEAFDGKNGWGIKPSVAVDDEARRDREDGQTLYEVLQDQVVPSYYDRNGMGYSERWVRMAKRSMASIMPRFNSTRMVSEYVARFYIQASTQGKIYAHDQYANAQKVAAWKARVTRAWSGVSVRRLDEPVRRMRFGSSLKVRVGVHLNGLGPEDVAVEIVIHRASKAPHEANQRYRMTVNDRASEGGQHVFEYDLTPDLCGKLAYRIRVYPWHELLTHPFELGLMHWL